MSDEKIYQPGVWMTSGPKTTDLLDNSPVDILEQALDDGYAVVMFLGNVPGICGNCSWVDTRILQKYTCQQKYVYIHLLRDQTDTLHIVKRKDKKYEEYDRNPQFDAMKSYSIEHFSLNSGFDFPTLIVAFKLDDQVIYKRQLFGSDIQKQIRDAFKEKYGIKAQVHPNEESDEFKEFAAEWFEKYLYANLEENGYNKTVDTTEKLYSVQFIGQSGDQIGSTQSVREGFNAVPPSAPNIPGYVFSGWQPSHKNIQKNTVCFAQYTQKQYESPRVVSEINKETTKFMYS